MSPERVAHGYSSNSLFKPYARNVLPSLLPTSSFGPDNGSGPSFILQNGGVQVPPSVQNVERHGFPTYAQYKQIETGYIESLTPRRQGKALISQSMFDRIWDVLHHPESQLETAQFRFWARKMFTLNKNYRITLGVAEGQESPPQEVLLHDNLLVAIQEQLYDLLCYCHGSTGHGGRDKTCALIRKHYTWVPKDLVSNFIKACPTCIMKKCGNMDVNAQIPQMTAEADKMSPGSARLISGSQAQLSDENTIPSVRHRRHAAVAKTHEPPAVTVNGDGSILGFSDSVYLKMSASLGSMSAMQDGTSQLVATSLPWSLIGSHHQGLTLPPLMSSDHTNHDEAASVHGNNNAMHSAAHLGNYQFQPMVREVSLYKGLPNGWQYRHDDFESAHAEFMDTKRQWDATGGNSMADDLQDFRNMAPYAPPRIPDIAGLWGPEQFRSLVKEEEDEAAAGGLTHHQFPLPPAMIRSLDLSDSTFPSALRNFQPHQSMGSPHLSDHGFMHQIDPALLALSEPSAITVSQSGSASMMMAFDNSDIKYEQHQVASRELIDESQPGMSTSSTGGSISSRRANAPPPLDLLRFQNPDLSHAPVVALQGEANSVVEEQGEEAFASSPQNRKMAPRTTSTSSVESTTTQLLSPFSPTDSETSTPASSAATSPVDEAHDKGELRVPVKDEKGAVHTDGTSGEGVQLGVQIKVEPV